jgi:serine/threonine protein kinase
MAAVDPNRWSVLSPYLDDVLEVPEDSRESWLSDLRTRDPALANEVRALLEEHRVLAKARFLEHGPVSMAGPSPGQRAGAYTLVSPIGAGGMGAVWLAERSDGRFERRAAVKFLAVALAGRGEQRFRREGRLLARLTHPHIAQLLDAGVTSGGQPFFVIEHVDGLPIDEYCRQRGLDVEARIRLFLDVLDAVAHAHAHLIVHRDLKPSNVHVTTYGKAKLLDFGIAKLIEDEDGAGDATLLTREGNALTPAYAAPEQVTGAPVSTATDVYALGALLYLLLAGAHPAGESFRSTAALLKAIVDAEPLRASDAAARAIGPDRQRRLRGDVDTILAKALKKAPAHRYASVAALADDLRRHLAHQPINARPDTIVYRSAKFVRRNRIPVAAGILTLAGLFAGLYVANAQREVAERRFDEVRGLAQKLLDLDRKVLLLPGSSDARQLIVDTSLEYLQRVAADVGDDPALALELGTAYMRVARVQGVPISTNLGQPETAEQNLRIAESLVGEALDARPTNRTALLTMAQIAHDRMALAALRREAEESFRLNRISAEWLERFLAARPLERVEVENALVVLINVANRFRLEKHPDEALRWYAVGIDVGREAEIDEYQIGPLLNFRALVHRDRGDLDAALADSREAARALTPRPGETNQGRRLNYALALARQGILLGDDEDVSFGRPADALPLFRQAFALVDAEVHADPGDANSRSRLETSGLRLARLLRDSDPAESVAVYDHLLAHWAEVATDPKFRRDEARALAGSTYALRRLGSAAEARERLDAALARLAQTGLYPKDSVEPASEAHVVLRALADHEAAVGNVERAVEVYRDLLARVLASGAEPETDLPVAVSLSRLYADLAALERRLRRTGPAAELDDRRLALWQHWATQLPGNEFVARQLADAIPQ